MRLTELVTPMKPLESMAMVKVLVASDVGGHKELIKDGVTGVLFKAGDEKAFVQSLLALLADEELRTRIEREARQWVGECHTWEKTTEVYKAVYQRLHHGG